MASSGALRALLSRGLTPELTRRANLLLPGMYAWLTTVAYPASQRGVSEAARATALLALIALLIGPLLMLDRPVLGRAFGLYGFFGLSLTTWLLLGPAIAVEQLEPMRSVLGGVGWALFAFGWGSVRRVGTIPEDDPHVIPGPPLAPRGRPPAGALVVLAVSLSGSLALMTLAWRVLRADHALFAQAAALLGALWLIDAGAKVALGRGQSYSKAVLRERIRAALRPLAMLAVLLAVAVAAELLR